MAKYLILQSKLFIAITAIAIALSYFIVDKTNASSVLPLILVIAFFGVPHGALDTLFAKKAFALNNIKSWLKFVSIYLSLSIGVFICWMLLPTVFFILFLFFSALHFSDDLGNIKPKLIGHLYGLNIIMMPSVLHSNELATFYGYLIDDGHAIRIVNFMIPFSLMLAWLTIVVTIVFYLKKTLIDKRCLWELLGVSLLMILAKPLVAFTIYFCFMHSARHILRAKFYFIEYSNKALIFTLFVPTLIVIVFCMLIFQMLPTGKFDESLIKITFATLAALTFPHAYLLGKVGFLKWLNHYTEQAVTSN
jgi:Brp/Blh family beta-carotene 15,15'-monooxygenase